MAHQIELDDPLTTTLLIGSEPSKLHVGLPLIGSLSTLIFETRTANGSELFSLLTCLQTTTFTFLSTFSPLAMISVKICARNVLFRLPSASQKPACLSSLFSFTASNSRSKNRKYSLLMGRSHHRSTSLGYGLLYIWNVLYLNPGSWDLMLRSQINTVK